MAYGAKTRSQFGTTAVIGSVETSPSGNLVLRVGNLLDDGSGWFQTEHVVLTPEEWAEFRNEADAALEGA